MQGSTFTSGVVKVGGGATGRDSKKEVHCLRLSLKLDL
jgi:hypothetical protein